MTTPPERSGDADVNPPIPGAWFVTLLFAAVIVAIGASRIARPIALSEAAAGRTLPDMRIDLNHASAAELSVLPGIGPRLADRIAVDRDANGPFETVDDLARVHGIGPAIAARVGPYAVADPVE